MAHSDDDVAWNRWTWPGTIAPQEEHRGSSREHRRGRGGNRLLLLRIRQEAQAVLQVKAALALRRPEPVSQRGNRALPGTAGCAVPRPPRPLQLPQSRPSAE